MLGKKLTPFKIANTRLATTFPSLNLLCVMPGIMGLPGYTYTDNPQHCTAREVAGLPGASSPNPDKIKERY